MESTILAACFFVSIVANIALMAGLLAKRQRTSLAFTGTTMTVPLHQGNVHLITGLVLYEKGRQGEAIAMLQEAVRQDPDDRMADAMLQIALNSGVHRIAGLAPGRIRQQLPTKAGPDPDGIIDAVIQDVTADDALLAGAATDTTKSLDPAASPESAGGSAAADLLASAEAGLADLVRTGLAMVRQGEVDAALAHFDGLLRDHPGSRIAMTGRAIALKHAGREDDAAEVLRQTLSEPASRD
jgi:Flp pilus assembly protein TadD